MTDMIASTGDLPGTAPQREQLARLVSAMLPADAGMPPGNHPEIFTSLLKTLGDSPATTAAGFETLANLAASAGTPPDYLDLLDPLKAEEPAFFQLLQTTLLTVYYQHPAVLSAIGVAPRPPYPAGRSVPATDWTLLEPVRTRRPFFRED
ncbi:MAG: hypothetical protein O3B72_00630 [Proteobacteria bacterium]|nr:hypothetical protein [Pseudomonadota bacterium]